MKKAIIFGVTGQDGSYLAEFLLKKNYTVFGVSRRTSFANDGRIRHLLENDSFKLLEGDVTDAHSVNSIIDEYALDEVYNLAAQSHVRTSFDQPVLTWNVTAGGALNILEALRRFVPEAKYYQAGSSEMFGASIGKIYGSPLPNTKSENVGNSHYEQDEDTPFQPRSPYGVAKLAAHHLTKIYREGYKLFACNGILFNHESERRGREFVSRKISLYVARMHKLARQYNVTPQELPSLPVFTKLKLGNLEAYRDWGYAPDFVEAMWLMLQQPTPDDYVIATGETHTVRDFLVTAFDVGLGYYSDRFIETDLSLHRAAEVNYLCGNYSKAKRILGWQPKTKFDDLVYNMVVSDIRNNELIGEIK